MIRVVLAIALLSLLPACGGSSGNSSAKPPAQTSEQDSAQAKRAAAIRKLDQRQEAACESVCPAMTRCLIADARKNMSPEQLAKPPGLARLTELAQQKCVSDCSGSPRSLRQIKIFESCAQQELACSKLLDCLDQANPKR